MRELIIVLVVLVVINPLIVFAQSDRILITLSNTMDQVNFDGKWSFITEWKRSSQDLFNNGNIILRTAHQGDFIYVFIDNLSDITIDKKLDYAVICFDGKSEKALLADDNDYCFMGTVGDKTGIIYNGYSLLTSNDSFREISNDPEFVAVGEESDNNDRYSEVIHSSYEFKIPIKLIGRESSYGFYFSIYDSEQQKIFHWPESINSDKSHYIPSPSKWGELVSPDKSLPEFPLSISVLIITMSVIIGVSRMKVNFKINN